MNKLIILLLIGLFLNVQVFATQVPDSVITLQVDLKKRVQVIENIVHRVVVF
ncbi:hypothetical protein ACFOG5_24850 [Pedobacter fastidiosus]|uniref:hypothetical protein n=1 Tax=Pedobacter fastidiosus TaxID=2765361 RepID=UPI0036225B5F